MFHNAALKRTALTPYDWALLAVGASLLILGLVMVYSASTAIAVKHSGNGNHLFYATRHAAYLILALAGAYAVFQIPTGVWQRWAPRLFIGIAVLLALVWLPVIGREVNGSQRWIGLGPLGNLQPSELMKFATVLYAADYMVRKADHVKSLKRGFLPLFLVMLGVGFLLLLQPDYGALVVITVIALSILFLGGFNARMFFGLTALLLVGFVILVIVSPYRMARVVTYMDPWKDPLNSGYQLVNALITLGRGQLTGVGLGDGVGKLLYLPESHTDFLLAVIGEELGLIGVLAVVALFAWLTWRAFSIGWQASLMDRNFQALVAQGVGVWLGLQSFINMGVNMGLLPTKGLTLPFMSYGGSSLVATSLALALLLRVDYENRCLMRGKKA